ncbi:AAA family ATPase [Micromonospora chalcea]
MSAEKSRPGRGGSPSNCDATNGTGIVGNSPVLDAALEYAAQGLYVFPARYGTKGQEKVDFHPLPDWRKGSTTNADQIRRWFGPGGKWEGAALAIDCARSGLVVVDADVTKGQRGPQEWAALDAPATWSVRTPTGGEHWYYREDPAHPIGNDQSGKVAPGVDVRGLGGLVIAPPTVDARGRYAWMEGAPQWSELPTVPRVVVERMTKRRPEPTTEPPPAPTPAGATYGQTPWTPQQADREINRELDRLAVAESGTRNGALNNAAMRLGHFVPHYLPRETAVALLTGRARGIGLDESEILPTINSGLTAGMREPYAVTASGSADSAEPTVDAVDALLSRMLDRDALDKIPAPKPLIRDVLDLDSESWVIGAPGGFKSFVALDWACHVATGQEWRGKPVTQGRVVYVAAEGQKGIPLRVKAWEAMYGRRADNVLFLPDPVQVADTAAWRVLVQACRRLEPVLIVLDTQARITVGLDENSNGAMSVLTEAVRSLKAATRACVLVVHHTGRNGGDARGASAIDGAQDTEIRVERPEAKGKRAALTATIGTDKQKDGDESVRFDVQLQVMDLGTDPETGRALSSLALRPLDPFADPVARAEPEWDADLTQNQVAVLEALRKVGDSERGATQVEVKRSINEFRKVRGLEKSMAQTSFSTARDALEGKGLIVVNGSRLFLPEHVAEE